MTNSETAEPTEVILGVTSYKGASVLLIDFVMNREQRMSACPLIEAHGVVHETITARTAAGFRLMTAKRNESSTIPVREFLEGIRAKLLGLSGGQQVSL